MKTAIIKLYTIRDRIKRLSDYAVNPLKTEQGEMTSVLNLTGVNAASDEMNATKEYWDKVFGVQGYHIIQSFPPNEVTRERCHEIGRELAKRMFGDEYEVVIGTHLDKNHYHNHIVANSVNKLNGNKFRCQKSTYFNIRDISDQICFEQGLSVLPNGKETKGKHYAEWKAEREGGWTIRQQIRDDIDEFIPKSIGFKNLLDWLKGTKGYQIDYSGKYPKVKPPFSQNWIRISEKLGKDYTKEAIRERIDNSFLIRENRNILPYRPISHYRAVLSRKRPKMTSFERLYWHYIYLIRRVQKKQAPPKLTAYMQAEMWKLNRLVKQYQFIHENKIAGREHLEVIEGDILAKMERLMVERQDLYKSRKSEPNEEKDKSVADIGQELKILRQQAKLCEYIKEDAPSIEERLERIINKEQHLQTERKKARDVGVSR